METVLPEARGRGTVLLDSLTLWVSARLQGGEGDGVVEDLDELLGAAKHGEVQIVVVSDEVGLGGIAGGAAEREFADLLGSSNQRAAELADEVYLCVAGIPVRIK